jgi:hypothetical protein
MAALDFPTPSTIGQIYTANGKSWRWDGVSWRAYNLAGSTSGILGVAGGGTGRSTISYVNAFLSSDITGTALQYRTFTASTGIAITITPTDVSFSTTSAGNLSGSGTSAYIPIWTAGGTALADSIMYQNGTVVNVAGNIKAHTKSFLIPHPNDPENKLLEHGSLEGPEHGAYLRGTASGKKQVDVNFPDYWQPLIEDNYTIHLTSKGKYQIYIHSQSSNGFSVRRCGMDIFSNSIIEFDYLVIGERRDTKIKLIQNRQI